ncbi:unnamed protein product [Owenia fusiformis]|uniref:Uncharacterized protein n=1 Tax=Owenia fusiformis TaxID=6347 RepID=A0A8J1TYV4_OWEFU|nr:unnamed protein product [Owenia fusiformis]
MTTAGVRVVILVMMTVSSARSNDDDDDRRVTRDDMKAAIDYATACGCPVFACIGRMQTCLLSGICKQCSMALPGKRQQNNLVFGKLKPINDAERVRKPVSFINSDADANVEFALNNDFRLNRHFPKYEKRFWQVSFPKYRPSPKQPKTGQDKLKEIIRNFKEPERQRTTAQATRIYAIQNPFVDVHRMWRNALIGIPYTGWFKRPL